MRSFRRPILILTLVGLLAAPTTPALAADTTAPGLTERVIDWIEWSLDFVSVFVSQNAAEPTPFDDPPTTEITTEGAPETSSDGTDGEMYPEWDPNG